MAARNSLATIKLSDQQKKEVLSELEGFYLDVLDEDITTLRKEQLYDFMLETVAPIIYDKALDDASNWLRAQMENLSIDFTLLYKNLHQ